MKFYESIDLSNVLIVRMKSKDDIREKLMEVVEKNGFKRAVILSAIGSVFEASFYGVKPGSELPYGKDRITTLKKKGPFEVLTMEGNILPMGDNLIPHIHVTLGAHDGTVIGGHLETAIVYTTIELFLAEVRQSTVEKQDDEIAGGQQIRLPISD
ncbi:PPC domain-containing DNA-binding protein [[Eubacterium] cellulosolvens]